MIVKNIYVAEDGTEFYDKTACEQYEANLCELRYKPLADYIVFRKADGTIVPYSTVERNEYSARFVYVKQMPYYEAEIERLWWDIASSELYEAVQGCGCGWYWLNDYDHWVSFQDVAADYFSFKDQIEFFENRG